MNLILELRLGQRVGLAVTLRLHPRCPPGANIIREFACSLSDKEIAMVSKRCRGPMDRREFLRVCGAVPVGLGMSGAEPTTHLPSGVKIVWDLGKAYRETTP